MQSSNTYYFRNIIKPKMVSEALKPGTICAQTTWGQRESGWCSCWESLIRGEKEKQILTNSRCLNIFKATCCQISIAQERGKWEHQPDKKPSLPRPGMRGQNLLLFVKSMVLRMTHFPARGPQLFILCRPATSSLLQDLSAGSNVKKEIMISKWK